MLSLIGDMAVLACVKLCLLHLRVVVEILGDKAIEWLLDMIITNSNDTIVTSTTPRLIIFESSSHKIQNLVISPLQSIESPIKNKKCLPYL